MTCNNERKTVDESNWMTPTRSNVRQTNRSKTHKQDGKGKPSTMFGMSEPTNAAELGEQVKMNGAAWLGYSVTKSWLGR